MQSTMPKRTHEAVLEEGESRLPNKKARVQTKELYNKVATAAAAATVDRDPPLYKLLHLVKSRPKNTGRGDAVVYWMRMEDMRIIDNRALDAASKQAEEDSVPLIVLFIISPEDYKAHDRGPRRIDFMLRNLSIIKDQLAELHIPLGVFTLKPRRLIPEKVVCILEELNSKFLFANISYELDELRRDIKICELSRLKNLQCLFVQDKLVVDPGVLKTNEGKPYAIYSPWQRKWLSHLNSNLDLLSEAPRPRSNDRSIRSSEKFSKMFDIVVPDVVDSFVCHDRDNMKKYWPAGSDVAYTILNRFLHTRARAEQLSDVSPISDGAEESVKDSRITKYAEERNHASTDTTSRLSPYLASGVISARACIRATMNLLKSTKVEGSRGNGIGMWVQEVAWRDFYNHVLVAFPRVSMGRPYLEKFASVKWEVNEQHLQAWKDGRTGVPIVDAAMRQLIEFGWMHNRCRMIVAMYLTKDLMLDWRLGEKYFMENLIDGDLASNNGGWQWSASTGTDPQPYFRIFNPISQSEKADPTGDYIRHYVPELAKLTGKAIHDPPSESASKHAYPKPLVDHKKARERALRRYKNPGEE